MLLDIVFLELEMSQKRLPPLEQLGLLVVSKDFAVQIGLVGMMAMDIALLLLVDKAVASSQVLLETMGLSDFYLVV